MARDVTGKRHGRGGNVGRMARDETGKLARAGRKRRADGARRNGKTGTGGAETSGGWRATKRENWHGRGGNVGRMARDETGKLARAGRKRRADGARRNGKSGTGGAENPKRGGGKIDASRPQQQTQPNKLAVTPE